MNARFAIPEQSFPYKSYTELFGALTAEQCKKIQDLGELLVFNKGSVGDNVTDSKVRNSNVAWIDDNQQDMGTFELRRDIIGQMQHYMGMINRDKFQLDLDGFDPIQYTQYELNQHYDWHVDIHEGKETNAHRKMSAVVMLSSPDDYEGGELQFNIGGNPDNVVSLRPPQGTIVAFYSHLPHRVTPVTSGNRTTLVIWALGPKFR